LNNFDAHLISMVSICQSGCFMCDRKSKHLQQDMRSMTVRLKSMTATVEKVLHHCHLQLWHHMQRFLSLLTLILW